ncbi:MAG: ClpXP protease specificity-enhancing factor [Pigmentiphaga sp.]|nr:ClpXP protease specificity-enhancing factor [Pigmentiphaga sp.]
MSELSTKPYLIRALHEWCTDSGYTPHISVAVDERCLVPPEHVKDGQIVLNIGSLATHKLELGNEYIEFQARFGGVARQISVPVYAVAAIFARETGNGMAFEVGEAEDLPEEGMPGQQGNDGPRLTPVTSQDEDPEPPPSSPGPGSKRPSLRIVK